MGNEGDIVDFYTNSGFLAQTLYEKFNARILFIEHRFYILKNFLIKIFFKNYLLFLDILVLLNHLEPWKLLTLFQI